MNQLTTKAFDKASHLIVTNAQTMIRSIVSNMRVSIAADSSLESSSFILLGLKVGSNSLFVEFSKSIQSSLNMINEKRKGDSSINTPFTLMSLSQLSDEDSYFKESSAAMNDLLKNTNVENSVLMNFDRSFFLGATFESLKNSRFTQAEVETLLPYIFGALNIELVSIYSQAYFG